MLGYLEVGNQIRSYELVDPRKRDGVFVTAGPRLELLPYRHYSVTALIHDRSMVRDVAGRLGLEELA